MASSEAPSHGPPGGAPRARRWRGRPLGLALALAVALALGGGWLAAELRADPPPELPVLGEVPSFELVDQTGAQVSADDLRGQPVIANFIFTRCPTICPVFSQKMKRVQERTADLGARLQLVSFSVDPEHDTPARLARYASDFGADPDRWSFVTGSRQAIHQTVREGLKISMERTGTLPGGAPDIAHNVHFVLLDRHLRIRGYYDSGDQERIDAMVRHARHLARPGGDANAR